MKIFGMNLFAHFAWLSVIAAAVFYAENRLERADLLRNDLFTASENALPVVAKIAGSNYSSIQKHSYAYPCPYNNRLDSMTELAKTEVQKFIEANELLARNAFAGNHGDAENEAQKQLADFQKLTTQLASFCETDTAAAAELNSPLVSINATEKIVEWIDLLKKKHPSAELALFKNLAFRASLAEKTVSLSIEKRMENSEDLVSWNMIPSISIARPIRAGETLEADFFCNQYLSKANNLTCKINGKAWPINNGLVQFEQVYSKPGRKKIAVQFIIKNLITGEEKSFFKDFAIKVQP